MGTWHAACMVLVLLSFLFHPYSYQMFDRVVELLDFTLEETLILLQTLPGRKAAKTLKEKARLCQL